MQFDYKVLEKKLGMENYNPSLTSQLIGIGQEYDTVVAKNNATIFTGKLKLKGSTLKFPATLKERLKAQRFATSAKIKVIEKYRELYTPSQIISAITGFKP